MTRRIRTTVLMMFLAVSGASAADDDIERMCTARYPGVWKYLEWKDCVKREIDRQQIEDQNRAREQLARPCIAAEIPRMEELVARAGKAINSDWSLEKTREALDPIFGYRGEIAISNQNIKERVLVYRIHTKCDTSFFLLVNVLADEQGSLRYIRTWAENAPAGYPVNKNYSYDPSDHYVLRDYSIDFEARRREERFRAEQEKDRQRAAEDRQRAAEALAKEEQQREQQRQALMRSVKLSEIKQTCLLGDCRMLRFDFFVTNNSKQKVFEISIGWAPATPQMTCPGDYPRRERIYDSLAPGEMAPVSMSVSNPPKSTTFCLAVVDATFR